LEEHWSTELRVGLARPDIAMFFNELLALVDFTDYESA
jgi:hypothetical protein